jgi:Tol biopolymer transport system component
MTIRRRAVATLPLVVLLSLAFPPPTGDAAQPSSGSETTASSVVSRFAFPGRNGRIVFVDTVGQFGSDVFTVRPDGTGRRRLTFSMQAGGPQWAPFGRRILFGAVQGTGTDLWVTGHRGHHKHRVLRAGPLTDLEAAWAPGGHRLVVARNGEGVSRLLVYSFETKVATPITPNGRAVLVDSPAWSPDGRRIVFRREGVDGARSDLWSIRPNGTDLTRLTFTPTPDLVEVGPNWSPDGSRILFSRRVFGEPSCSRLFTIRSDGTGLTRLQAGCPWSEAAWSPNGRKIVVSRDGPRGSRLWTMSADGSSRSFLVTGRSPDWQRKR